MHCSCSSYASDAEPERCVSVVLWTSLATDMQLIVTGALGADTKFGVGLTNGTERHICIIQLTTTTGRYGQADCTCDARAGAGSGGAASPHSSV